MYHIGKITNTHGIKGEVKIYNLSDFDRFFVGATLYTIISGEKVFFKIKQLRSQKNVLIVKFDGYDDINQILKYKGLDLYSDDEIIDQLEDDDYHYQSLIDKDCYTPQGLLLGKVKRLVEVPQGHLIEVEKTDGKFALVPFVKAFILEILDDRIIIETIEGLL
jgi:16S rRNA processing protein RimM